MGKQESIRNVREYYGERAEQILRAIIPRPSLLSPANEICSALYSYKGYVYNVEGLLYYILGVSSEEISNDSWILGEGG